VSIFSATAIFVRERRWPQPGRPVRGPWCNQVEKSEQKAEAKLTDVIIPDSLCCCSGRSLASVPSDCDDPPKYSCSTASLTVFLITGPLSPAQFQLYWCMLWVISPQNCKTCNSASRRHMALALDSRQRKEINTLYIRNLTVDKARMTPGHWLGLMLSAVLSAATMMVGWHKKHSKHSKM